MRSYQIHLIRHALPEGAAEGRYIGHTDVPLSEEGKAQLIQMRDEMRYPYAEAVFTSPLKRCTETAKILYPDKEALVIDALIECNFGEFENKTAEELSGNEDFSAWLAGRSAPPFGESSNAFGQRVCAAFEKIVDGMMKSGVYETAIITHGGVIGAILSAYGIPEAPMHEWMTPNCCGFSLRGDTALWMRNRKLEVFAETPSE